MMYQIKSTPFSLSFKALHKLASAFLCSLLSCDVCSRSPMSCQNGGHQTCPEYSPNFTNLPNTTHTFLSLYLCSCSSTFPDICTANFSSSKCNASLKAGLHLILTSFIEWKLFLCLISVTQLNLPNVALHALFILLAVYSSRYYTKHHSLL